MRNVIWVCDNGCGMTMDEFKFCFRPNVSFKSRKESRGHKGVGATFIAYGFSYVKLATNKDGTVIAGQLTNGRKWAEDTSGSYSRPTFSSVEAIPQGVQASKSGTYVEVGLDENQRPILPWIQATSAEQWLSLFRIKTPIGGVYLSAVGRDFNVSLSVTVVDMNGTKSEVTAENIDYYYPHEIPLINKAQSISDIDKKVASMSGDPNSRLSRLPDDFRRLDAVWEVWKAEDLLKNNNFIRNLDEDQKILIQRHNTTVYGCFLSTAKTWTAFQKDVLRVRQNAVLLRGGLQMASDYMPQGDLSVIPLTSTIGYQNNTHIVIHLDDGNPDMGRKVFQPEVKAVADELSRRVVDHFKQYLSLMREDTGAPPMSTARDLRDYVIRQEKHRTEHPYALRFGERKVAILSTPQSEQDVIALFHELLGTGILRGFGFLATSESNIYDSVFVTQYAGDDIIYSADRALGVSEKVDRRESVPHILEYKFDSDALVDDFAKEKKYVVDINLLVCWNIGPKTKRELRVS